MCLITNTQIPSIAQEDIVCYKELVAWSPNPLIYETPFKSALLRLDFLPYTFIAEGKKEVNFSCGFFVIGEGFIHCYRDKEYALKRINHIFIDGSTIFKCIIPKSTKFYANNIEICADKIIILKKVRR